MIKSKERISAYGEVFTSEREVAAMLDLVEDETYRIESRFLEPACGDGNFLVEVLLRKFDQVCLKYSNSRSEFEKNLFWAVTSVYGIDILEDNAHECRERIASLINLTHRKFFDQITADFQQAILFVLSKNIIHGDATSLLSADGKTPIVFSEWSFVSELKIKRTDYTLSNLLAYQPFDGDSLFSDLGDETIIPHPLKTYPLVNYREVHLAEK